MVRTMTFYETLELVMREKGVTAAEICERANMHPSYISKLKSGHMRSPTWENAIAIIDALGLTLGEFAAIQQRK